MNDEQLITALRSPLADVHLNVPLEDIERRGRARRRRRRIVATAATATALAGTAALVIPNLASDASTLTPPPAVRTQIAGPSPSPHRTPVVHAAWAVATRQDGSVRVTIHQLQDAADLQAELRADGIPANVSFQSPPRLLPPGGCQQYDPHSGYFALAPAGTEDDTVVFTIDPTTIPDGAGVALEAGYDTNGMMLGAQTLVQAGPDCTGT